MNANILTHFFRFFGLFDEKKNMEFNNCVRCWIDVWKWRFYAIFFGILNLCDAGNHSFTNATIIVHIRICEKSQRNNIIELAYTKTCHTYSIIKHRKSRGKKTHKNTTQKIFFFLLNKNTLWLNAFFALLAFKSEFVFNYL